MAYITTPKSSTTAVAAATPTKVPATAQVSRVMLKLYNEDDSNIIYYGDSLLDSTKGIPVMPGTESDWIPCSGDIYVWCAIALNVRSLEGA